MPNLLRRSRLVTGVELRGSRARGTAGRFSDWDFVVRTEDFTALAGQLPMIVDPLQPLVRQWDRLSDTQCYMLIVPGPVKIDLIFEDVPHNHEPPWRVDERTLPAIDHHFWDWTLWLASKVDAGKRETVAAELAKMHQHLLAPMGIAETPSSPEEAVAQYLETLGEWERRLGIVIDRSTGDAVMRVVTALST